MKYTVTLWCIFSKTLGLPHLDLSKAFIEAVEGTSLGSFTSLGTVWLCFCTTNVKDTYEDPTNPSLRPWKVLCDMTPAQRWRKALMRTQPILPCVLWKYSVTQPLHNERGEHSGGPNQSSSLASLGSICWEPRAMRVSESEIKWCREGSGKYDSWWWKEEFVKREVNGAIK